MSALKIAVCRGCGAVDSPTAFERGFCPRCFASFAGELFSLYDWMKTQAAEAQKRRDLAFVELLLPTYRHTLRQAEELRSKALYPEGLLDYANAAQDALGLLEIIRLRGSTAVSTTVSSCRKTIDTIEADLTQIQNGDTVQEITVRAFFYYSRLLRFLYDKELLPRERNFEEDERRAVSLFSQIASADTPPLDENDHTFGPSPAEIFDHITDVAFGDIS